MRELHIIIGTMYLTMPFPASISDYRVQGRYGNERFHTFALEIRNAIDGDSNVVFRYAVVTSVRGRVDFKAQCTYVPQSTDNLNGREERPPISTRSHFARHSDLLQLDRLLQGRQGHHDETRRGKRCQYARYTQYAKHARNALNA
jgi:hypothetical protein